MRTSGRRSVLSICDREDFSSFSLFHVSFASTLRRAQRAFSAFSAEFAHRSAHRILPRAQTASVQITTLHSLLARSFCASLLRRFLRKSLARFAAAHAANPLLARCTHARGLSPAHTSAARSACCIGGGSVAALPSPPAAVPLTRSLVPRLRSLRSLRRRLALSQSRRPARSGCACFAGSGSGFASTP